jgi:hypothetical protein
VLHEPCPHVGHHKNLPTSEVTQWHEQFTLRRFAGEGAIPLTRSPEPATNNHQHVADLHRCSKPSRWWQLSRVTRNLQPQRSPSATRCNHSSKYTYNHSISLWIRNQAREMSGREFAQLTRMSKMSNDQERCLGANSFLFIESLKQIEPLTLGLGSARGDRTCRSWWPDMPVQHTVAPQSHPALATSCDSKVAIIANTHVVITGCAPASIRRHVSPSPVSSRDVPGRENDDQTC